jgi:hypothetical protein
MFCLLLLLSLPLACTAAKAAGSDEARDEACTTWYDRMAHGPTFHNVKDHGAKGDGRTDDSLAIQRALDVGRQNASGWRGEDPTGALIKAPAIVYLPPGTYVISQPLVMWFYTHLIGSFACPPTLRLRDGSFNDSAALQPMIVTTPGFNQSVEPTRTGKTPGRTLASTPSCIIYVWTWAGTLEHLACCGMSRSRPASATFTSTPHTVQSGWT